MENWPDSETKRALLRLKNKKAGKAERVTEGGEPKPKKRKKAKNGAAAVLG